MTDDLHVPENGRDASSAAASTDDKGYSEETCLRCGWTMGQPPLNCQNDDTPHRFPSSDAAFVTDALGGALANSDDLLRRLSEWDAMNVAPYAGDRDYWLGEIDNARTLNRIALQQAKEAV